MNELKFNSQVCTPKEKIDKEENLRFPPTKSIANSIIRAGFKEGAEYGYNLAIENVVEYLKANVSSFTLNSEEMDGLPKRNRVELHQLIKQVMKL